MKFVKFHSRLYAVPRQKQLLKPTKQAKAPKTVKKGTCNFLTGHY